MVSYESFFPSIQEAVHQIVPDAQVILFGSQANGKATEESDWDVLVLTKQTVDWDFKKKLWDQVFPLSVEAETVISLLIVQEQNWYENPSYYELRKSIAASRIVL